MDGLAELLIAFGRQLGILALLVVGLAASRRDAGPFTGPGQQAVAGLVFGAAAVFAMLDPIHVQPGVFVDTRSVVIAVAGPFGGPLAALVATALACACRGWIGGGGMPVALTALIGVALAGAAFGELVRRRRILLSASSLLGLALAVTGVNLLALLLLPAGAAGQALRTVALPLAGSNLVGIPLLGIILLERTQRRILRQELARALAIQSEQAERLRLSEARYRIVATSTADVIMRLDPALRRVYASPSVREVLGYAPEELLGRTPAGIAHPDDAPLLMRNLQALSGGSMERVGAVHRLRHRDGRWVWVESNSRAVLAENPRERQVVAVIRDISGRMELEEQVRQAQKMQALGHLTGGIAHDFNNIMTVVLGNAELLAAELAQPEQRGLVLEIQAAAERAAALTGKLLAFGRRQPLRPEVADLTLVANGMTGMLRRLLDPSVEMRTASGGPCPALFDVTLMQSAIVNLVINARDAVAGGGGLSIRTGRRLAGPQEGEIPEGAPVVFVTVEDDGTGMPPEVLERAFEPFFTTKEVGTGSGLGLSMVYGFARQSGGHVAIRSRPGDGTEVSIVLRAAEGGDAAGGDGAGPAEGAARVLVVEDDPNVARTAVAMLVPLGFRVTTASTAVDALGLLDAGQPFDLLFTDVAPGDGMDGVALAREAVARRPGLGVLLTAACPRDALAGRGALTEGMVLLGKPYRRSALAEALRRALAPAGVAGPAAAAARGAPAASEGLP